VHIVYNTGGSSKYQRGITEHINVLLICRPRLLLLKA